MRPAMAFIDEAAKFDSEIIVYKEDGSEANAESIMQITMLAVTNGTKIKITANGTDELEALEALEELINNDFNMSDIEN
jgi:phosphotransferase system HPr (HPr) family protein